MPPNLQRRMEDCERDLADVKSKVSEMHEEFVDLRGALRTIERVAAMLKPVLYVSGFIGAGYMFMKTGIWKAP